MNLSICIPCFSSTGYWKAVKSVIAAYLNLSEEISLEVNIVDQRKNNYENVTRLISGVVVNIYFQNPGLSKAKNRLLYESRDSDYVWFVDADCTIDINSLNNIKLIIKKVDKSFLFKIGTINSDSNYLRNWPNKSLNLTWAQAFYYSTSVNYIVRNRKNIYFDENFGLGSRYGSCEDKDFIINSDVRLYYPVTLIRHPKDIENTDIHRTFNYASGLGALCSKNFLKGIIILIAYTFFILLFKKNNKLKLIIIYGLFSGFFNYLLSNKFKLC